MKVTIDKLGINGEGIAHVNGKPIFIDNALKNEIVDINIYEQRKNYGFGKVKKYIKKDSSRKIPECKISEKCGACNIMHMEYDAQLKYKEDIVKESLFKYANLNKEIVKPIIKNDNPLGYRNSFKLPFQMVENHLTLGMYEKNSNHFVRLKKCFIHEKDLERIRKDILNVLNEEKYFAYDKKRKSGLRYLIVRGFNASYQCTIVTGNDEIKDTTIEKLMNIDGLVSLWQSINTQKNTIDLFGKKMTHLGGNRQLSFKLKDLSMTLSPKSFFQLNTKQAIKLYDLIASKINDSNDLIVEAYCGIGAISLFLHNKSKKIIGIEYISDAISNAKRNAKRNNINNCEFIVGDAAEKLTPISKKNKIDVLVVDPPRSGFDDNMIDTILKSNINKIIYVSCNPSTLAKNLKALDKKYQCLEVTPVDMFSESNHVETVVVLSKK